MTNKPKHNPILIIYYLTSFIHLYNLQSFIYLYITYIYKIKIKRVRHLTLEAKGSSSIRARTVQFHVLSISSFINFQQPVMNY